MQTVAWTCRQLVTRLVILITIFHGKAHVPPFGFQLAHATSILLDFNFLHPIPAFVGASLTLDFSCFLVFMCNYENWDHHSLQTVDWFRSLTSIWSYCWFMVGLMKAVRPIPMQVRATCFLWLKTSCASIILYLFISSLFCPALGPITAIACIS